MQPVPKNRKSSGVHAQDQKIVPKSSFTALSGFLGLAGRPFGSSVVGLRCLNWNHVSGCQLNVRPCFTHLNVKPTNKDRPIFSSLSAMRSSASCLSSTSLYLAMSFSEPKSSK